MLTLYFSATGNSKYIAELFSKEMNAKPISIEEDANFTQEIKEHDTIAFCYPIYGSRVPRILREFVVKYMGELSGKKLIIFVTQVAFSGDGARVFTDMFWEGTIEVIYAEHFKMPSNVGNVPLWKPTKRRVQRYLARAEAKMARTCDNIREGIVVKRGFSRFSQFLGNIQGRAWQGNSKEPAPAKFSAEQMAKTGVKIHRQCTACNICVAVCPMKNLENCQGAIKAKGDCTVCYRCVNRCPHRAITVMRFHRRPRWQYIAIYNRM